MKNGVEYEKLIIIINYSKKYYQGKQEIIRYKDSNLVIKSLNAMLMMTLDVTHTMGLKLP